MLYYCDWGRKGWNKMSVGFFGLLDVWYVYGYGFLLLLFGYVVYFGGLFVFFGFGNLYGIDFGFY